MTLLRANVTDILRVGLDKVFFDEWNTVQAEKYINAIFDVQSTDQNYEEDVDYYGVPMLSEKPEGAGLDSADSGIGYKTRLTYLMYGCYSAITKETRQDGKYNVVQKLPPNMRRAAQSTLNYYGSRIFTQGFSALPVHQTGGSGQNLFSTSHPLKGTGGTFANRPITGAALSGTTLWAGVTAFYEFLDHAGLPLEAKPETLLIPHQEKQTAIELLKSQLNPEMVENSINAIREEKLEYVVWPYWLGSVDTNAWYLLGSKKDMGLKFFWRNKIETESDNDFFTKDFLYSVLMGFSVGWVHPYNIYGNPGP